MKVVYIAHPVSGDVEGNIEKLKVICREINLSHKDVLPFVPYCMDILCLDDSNKSERKIGIENNTHHLTSGFIDELWLYGDHISNGMLAEIYICKNEFIKVVPKTEGTKADYMKVRFNKF